MKIIWITAIAFTVLLFINQMFGANTKRSIPRTARSSDSGQPSAPDLSGELVEFQSDNIKGDAGKKVIVHRGFVPYMERLQNVLKEFGATFLVTSSFRRTSNVKGAIVTPSKRSNHMVGYAIDTNILYNGTRYNSKAMQAQKGVIGDIIRAAKSTGLRWGGDFKTKDPVHFDVPINLEGSNWDIIYKAINS